MISCNIPQLARDGRLGAAERVLVAELLRLVLVRVMREDVSAQGAPPPRQIRSSEKTRPIVSKRQQSRRLEREREQRDSLSLSLSLGTVEREAL